MKIVFIGAGNLATNLAKALQKSGHDIVQIYSRTVQSAKLLADALDCDFTTEISSIITDSDLYIVSVKDSVLEGLMQQIRVGREGQFFVHTAGSMPMDSLPLARRGVLYPLQTFSKEKEVDFSHIPFFVEAANDADLCTLQTLATTLSDTVIQLSSADRRWLHVAAVFCCNFSNHMSTLAASLLENHGIPFSVMLPLIDETSRKLHHLAPREAQTGPAVRWDENVMNRHLQLLSDQPDMQKIYELLSQSIHDKL